MIKQSEDIEPFRYTQHVSVIDGRNYDAINALVYSDMR